VRTSADENVVISMSSAAPYRVVNPTTEEHTSDIQLPKRHVINQIALPLDGVDRSMSKTWHVI